MGGVPVLLFAAILGINYGWVPDQQGGVEYIIQVEPQKLREVERAGEISSTIPSEVQGHVSRIVVRVGTGPVPRETPAHFGRKTSYGLIRSTDAADTASMSAPAMGGTDQRSFKPEPDPQFGLPTNRPTTQANGNPNTTRVEPPGPSRPSTASTSGDWQNERTARSPFGSAGSGTPSRPSTAGSRTVSNAFGTNTARSTNNTAANDQRTNAVNTNPFNPGTLNAGARLGSTPSGMDLRGNNADSRIAEANQGRTQPDQPFFGPLTREATDAALRNAGQRTASQAGKFVRVTPNRNATWEGMPRISRDWLSAQGWTKQLYDSYRDQGGIIFRNVMPINVDGYTINASLEAVGQEPYATQAEILATYPELRDAPAASNSMASATRGASNANSIPSLERGAAVDRNPFQTQNSRSDDRYTMGASDRLNAPANRSVADRFNDQRESVPNTNFGNPFGGADPRDDVATNNEGRYSNRNIDTNRFSDPTTDNRLARGADPYERFRSTEPASSRSASERSASTRVDNTRSASDRVGSLYDERRYADREPLRSSSDERYLGESNAFHNRTVVDPYARDRFSTLSNRPGASELAIDDRRVNENAALARRAMEAEEAANREAEARALLEAENDRQKQNARTQRLFNALLLASVVGNFYLVYWLKNLRYRFRDMVAAKRGPSTPMSTVA